MFRYFFLKQESELARNVGVFVRLPNDLAKQYPDDGRKDEDDSPVHLTLAFIGKINLKEEDRLVESVENFLRTEHPLQLTLEKMAIFKNKEGQRIFHSPVSGLGLHFFNERIKGHLRKEGFEFDETYKTFRPHVTIEYVDPDEEPKHKANPEGTWKCNEVELWGMSKIHKFKMRRKLAIDEISETTIRRVGKEDIVSLHQRCHGLWESEKMEGTTRKNLASAHSLVVDEMVRRGLQHDQEGGIDNAAKEKISDGIIEKIIMQDDADFDFEFSIPILKVDKEKRLVTSIVLVPEKVDLQKEIISAEEIEKAAYDFLARYNQGTKLGLMHTFFGNIGLELVESWIEKVGCKMRKRNVPKGTWLATMRLKSDKLWEQVKSGKYRGFSVKGRANATSP